MNIDQIKTECFILALFIREDGERILLGSGEYEFKGSQLHFSADSYANDVVEVQGNDGVFLAGQVRRPTSQVFDGYVGDATVQKTKIEEYRRNFLAFFRKNYYYTVVYIFPDGTAIQRRKGFIVDAPEVKELYQVHPEYHIALNFEDVNYYSYSEDESGQETYTKNAIIYLSTGGVTGGLVWDSVGAVNLPYTWTDPVEFSGSDLTIDNELEIMVPLKDLEFRGDTFQQTYSGKNLLPNEITSQSFQGVTIIKNADGSLTLNGLVESGGSLTLGSFSAVSGVQYTINGVTGWSNNTLQLFGTSSVAFPAGNRIQCYNGPRTVTAQGNENVTIKLYIYSGQNYENVVIYPMIEQSASATSYEPYVGGVPAPNPDYPQDIQTVTGEQTVWLSGKNLFNGVLELGIINGATGLDGSNSNYIRCKDYIPVDEATAYSISSTNTSVTTIFVYEYTGDFSYNLTNNKSIGNGGSFTTNSGTKYVRFRPSIQSTDTSMEFQLEKGASATSYYPPAKSFELNLGKNLMPMPTASVSDSLRINNFNIDLPAGTYAMSFNVDSFSLGTNTSFGIYMNLRNSSNTSIIDSPILTVNSSTQLGRKTYIFTITDNASASVDSNIRVGQTLYDNGARVELSDIQIESGNRITDYAPYFTPIELSKIGNYQDYIYRDADGDWYIHKATGSITMDISIQAITDATGSSSSTVASYAGAFMVRKDNWDAAGGDYDNTIANALVSSNLGVYESQSIASNGNANIMIDGTFCQRSGNNDRIYFRNSGLTGKTGNEVKSLLAANSGGTNIYYAIATPTDTQITDETMINQLNAIGGTRLSVGQNNIVVRASGGDLPMILEGNYATAVVTAGAGFEWEEGGNGGPTTVMVDSIDKVYPVWSLTGPAVNPQLAVLETGTTLSYTGTITASQTLEIDMFNKTAKLNGTSVIGNVSGDWVYFEPGNNRVTYTTNNADALPSMIYWQEVVG